MFQSVAPRPGKIAFNVEPFPALSWEEQEESTHEDQTAPSQLSLVESIPEVEAIVDDAESNCETAEVVWVAPEASPHFRSSKKKERKTAPVQQKRLGAFFRH